MTLIAPVLGTPATVPDLAGFGYASFPDMQPFTQRDASGYQLTLEQIVKHLKALNVYFTQTNPQTTWDANVTALVAAVDAALSAQTTANAQAVSTALTAIATSSITITDPAMAAVLNNASSATLAFLDGRYVQPTQVAYLTAKVSPAPSGADDTALLQAWLTAQAGGKLTMRSLTYQITTLTIPAHTSLWAHGATFTVSGNGNGIVLSHDNSSLHGGEVNGTGMTLNGNLIGMGVLVSNAIRVTVEGVNAHDTPNCPISVDHGTNVQIIGNTCGVARNNSNGIGVTFSNGLKIEKNVLSGNVGIEVWGGDASNPGVTGYGCQDVQVIGNSCTGGGIFFAHVRDFTMNGNYSTGAPDVGVDAEGCLDGTIAGNVVEDANNYGVSLFYGCSGVTISGNTVRCSSAPAGLKHGIGIVTGNVSSDITISGNTVHVVGYGLWTDNDALIDSVIVGNRIHGDTYGAILQQCAEVTVEGNKITTLAARGIGLEGSYNCMVTGNRVQQVGGDSSTLGANGGIWTYSRGGSYLGGGNHIANNKVSGFATSIKINSGLNYVASNGVETIAYAAGTPGIQFTNNYLNSAPTTAVTATSV